MARTPYLPRRSRTLNQLAVLLVMGLAIIVNGRFMSRGRLVAAQAPPPALNPCGLLTNDEVHALASNENVTAGPPVSALESFICHYTWGAGVQRYVLAVSVDPASRMFAGMNSDSVKQSLQSSVVPGTADAAIPDVGETAVFRAHSAAFVTASAYLKGRVLQVTLDGIDARDEKAQVVSLLKSAASRLQAQ
jgi:hypothetical protein